MNIIVADDRALVRAGIRALLAEMPGISVVAEAADGREAVRLAHAHHPDVVVMDVTMPGMNGLEATERITSELPAVKVVIVSIYANEEYVWQALRAGAAGYILKDSTPAELEEALAAVGRGERYVSASLSQLVDSYKRRVGNVSPLDRLTPRQREVLQLIVEGNTNRAIAATLGISIKTVESHRTRLMETLDIHDVAGLVRFAVRVGLIRPA